ncbi:MAG: PorP/SprF family type IX secretion system membrane protein [Bacteroidota bacterium]
MRYFLIVLMLFFSPIVKGQDIHFSQFYENAILRNPALTGIFKGDYKAGVNYRNQWSSFDNRPFTTGLASAESKVRIKEDGADFLSFGLTSSYDRSGSIDFTSMQLYAAANYNKFIEEKHGTYLSLGLAFGYIQRSFDLSKMSFASQYINQGYSPGNPSYETLNFKRVQNFDVGLGLSLNGSLGAENKHNYYLGLAAYHATKPSHSFRGQGQIVNLLPKYVVSLGLNMTLNEKNSIAFHLNQTNQKPYKETIAGALFGWKKENSNLKNPLVFYAGIFYRYQDAFVPTLKVDFSIYSITMSYDVTTSSTRVANNFLGGYEVSMYCKGIFPSHNYTENFKCPKF